MEEKLAEPQVESQEDRFDDAPRPPRYSYRSLFWPVVLVGVGVFWLLFNLGIIQNVSFWGFLRLWPILLIFIGLDIMFGRRFPALGALIGLGAVGLVIFLLVIGPSRGWFTGGPRWPWPGFVIGGQVEYADVQTAHFEEAVDGASSADVTLNTDIWPVSVEALPAGSDNLIEADIAYVGEPIFDVSGGNSRSVTVGMQSGNIRVDTAFESDDYSWEIALSPDVPVNLDINGGFGSNTLDLADLQLTGLALNGGFGDMDLLLPGTEPGYDVDLNLGAGAVDIEIADDADIDMTVNGGFGETMIEVGENATLDLTANMGAGEFEVRTGEGTNADLSINGGFGGITIDTPGDAGVRLEVTSGGFGDVNVPSGFVRVQAGGEGRLLDNEGIWESPNYSSADYQVTITVGSLGAGDITINQ